MRILKNQNIKTWLPVFPGFYNTIYQYDDDSILYNINEDRKEKNLLPIDYDNLEIDYTQYENDIAGKFCEVIENVLENFVENINFEKIHSPKTYNFSTDVINCDIEPKIDNIQKFILENKEFFEKYLKNNYTSYDGFLSNFSNSFETWKENTENFTNFENRHILGSILQFIYNELNIDDIDIYYQVKENISEYQYIENINQCDNALICTNCNTFIESEKTLILMEKYKENTGKNPSKIICKNCADDA